MSERRYTAEHEWISLDGDIATVGITNHAQEALGDLVFVELPDTEREVSAGEACAVVESVKAASDVYAPLTGKITEVNGIVAEEPALVNREPEGEAWFFRMKIADRVAFDALMDAEQYKAFLETAA